MSSRSWPLPLALSVVLAACGGASPSPRAADGPLAVGKGKSEAAVAAPPAASEDDVAIPIGQSDAVRGRRDALVTIVVFSDFQCPFCSRLVPTFDRLAQRYGQDLRVVFKNEPLSFHEHARVAAEAGQGVLATAGQDAFWKFHDIAFERQRDLDDEKVVEWAGEAGANKSEIAAGLREKRWAAKVDADMQVAARVGAKGTPTSFVNGVLVGGAQPYSKFDDVVSSELGKAKALAEGGVAREKIYATAVAANLEQAKRHVDDDDDDDANDTKTVWKVPVGSSPVRGPATALVTIVEFSDFQCPYCKRAEATLERVRQEYGDKVRIVWKDEPLPFHPRAEPAAELARFARAQKGDAAFWAMHDMIFDAQPRLEDADLEALAKKAGLDAQKAMAAVKAKAHKKGIDADEELADGLQATGTPHFFINGRRLVGAHPFDKFKSIIDEEVTKADALVRAGTAKSALYDTLIKDGATAPGPERKWLEAAPADAPFRGAPNAKLVIQQVSDFQCPFCARAEGTLDELLKAYPGKIKIVWRDHPLPMHSDAELAAEAGREAYAQKGNEGFAKMQKLLFANQHNLKRADLDGYAQQIGLDPTKFAKALDTHVHKAKIDADEKAVTKAGASGTPAFFIGSYYVSGAQPLSKFKKIVDRALTEPAPMLGGPARTLPGGLVVKDMMVGSGREVKAGDKVSIHYVGTLPTGKEFDSSRGRGKSFDFVVGNGTVIKGMDQGVVGMKVGGLRKLTIPADLAYGDRGIEGTIPPKSTLEFEVELVSVQAP